MLYLKILFFLISSFSWDSRSVSNDDYIVIFDRIDNSVEILVNDSIVYQSGIIDNNPFLGDTYKIPLSIYLTEKKDEVIIRLYNGHPPYTEQSDTHWEIKYVIMNGDEQIDYFWDYADDNQVGLVFEEKYYF
ncbi:hypothetical protein SAMN05421640_0792 [Ekhidna lutea]|uniref:Uncharacterized protein n=1 Tax=Ekhidna lutea TaxID=447679 RepID=A0A239FR28_EKHLU|nr:hypothetical protein [Ekhidna lutea]SNS59215.1 hypothetical protein SAMN05421640_0792 [Ekhidna lutea]